MDELLALFQKRLDEMDQAKQAVKFDRWFNYLAIDTVGEVTFSKPFGFLEAGVDHGQTVATQHYLQIYLAVIGHFPWLHNATLANPLLEKWGLAPATFISDNCGKATNARLTNDKVRRDMMELWLDQFRKHPEKMSETEVSTTAMVTVGAGSDTISAILQTITYHLLRDRDMFLQLRQEIDNANLSPIPQYEETHRLPVLSACIKEALRHHPPVSTNYPRVSPPGGVTVCGRFFPAGTVLSVSPYAIHSIPEVFGANIDKFDPGRWLNASQTEHRNMENHLVAFGAGYNQCPGQQLARLELYKTAALMVRDYDVEQVEKSKEWKCDYHFGAIPYDWDCYVRRRKINEE